MSMPNIGVAKDRQEWLICTAHGHAESVASEQPLYKLPNAECVTRRRCCTSCQNSREGDMLTTTILDAESRFGPGMRQ
jgi:hypothetical protein